jgi:hypothetical protein
MESTYSKSKLLEMNSNRTLGFNWIMNIENIKDNELAKLYPTGNAGVSSGRLYVALPANKVITKELIEKYNIW